MQAVVAGAAWTIRPVLFYEISQPVPEGLGLSLVELGAIWGMYPLAVAFFCIPMGMRADRYGVRLVVGTGVSIPVALKCRDVWLLVIVLFASQGAFIGAIGFLPL